MSELKLRDDILDELEYEPIVDAAHIGVAVDRDVVTLTAHVGSYAQKLAAISAVRRVKGVHGIADEIEVRYASDAKASDDEITSRTLNVPSWDSVVPGNAIQVTVRDGLVILTGKVNWYYQKSSAERDIRGLSGGAQRCQQHRNRAACEARERQKEDRSGPAASRRNRSQGHTRHRPRR
jgi:osmotically-inducible protein OsmY